MSLMFAGPHCVASPVCADCWKSARLSALDKRYDLKRRYGISDAERDEMEIAQGGKCAICFSGSRLEVDHCHKSGAVRGLLCTQCNLLLGKAVDSAEILRRAANYIEAARDRETKNTH